MSYYAIDVGPNSLVHHGILGMKWGIRRYQNEDGSLTSAGRLRYYGAGGDRKGYYREKGAVKRYKDVLKAETKRAYRRTANPLTALSKGYRTWRKADPNNRGIANYALADRQKRIEAQFGNNKRLLADARYAYEHKKLAKYVNRDGSLTLAGKLKYWDTNKARGTARMQRDIAKDKSSLTTSQRQYEKYAAKDKNYFSKKNNKKLARNAILGLATGSPYFVGRTVGLAGRAIRGHNNIVGNPYKATINGRRFDPHKAEYGIRYQGNVETKTVNGVRKAAKYNYDTNMGTIKKVGSGVSKAAKYNYDTNMGTIKKVGSGVKNTARKRKRNS